MSGTVAVTGASGMLGRHLCDHFRRAGWTVRALMRRPGAYPFAADGVQRFVADLPGALDDAAFRGADVVIHAAYTTRFTELERARAVNEEGTMRVRQAARSAGVPRFIFVSSLAARPDAASYYGRSKHALEQRMDADDLIVRPGLVLARDAGLAHRLRGAVALARVMPLFGGGRQIAQTVHVDDLCRAFERAMALGLRGAVNVAEPEGVTMRELLHLLNRGRWALPLPIPVAPVLAGVRVLESIGLPFPFSSENLLGLVGMRHVPTAPDLARLGLTVRTARESAAAL